MDSAKKGLSPELAEKARVELNEIQSEVPGQIQALREKILENKKFNFRTDDVFLLKFLRARKFDQKRALELITKYYEQRKRHPQILRKLPSSGLEASLSSGFHGALLNKDSSGRSIMVCRVSHWDPTLVPMDDVIATLLLTLERLIEEDEAQINGIVVLVDMKGLSMKHLWHVSPMAANRIVSFLVNCFPVRFKAIHYINEPYLFDALFLVLKPFLSKKLLSRISFHGASTDLLHQTISPDILPEEFGGHLGSFDAAEWNQVLKSYEDTARKNALYGFLAEK